MGWFDGVVGDVISGGASLLGGMMSNNSNQQSASQAQAASAAEAQKNRDWQEYMSNTSYQRGIADMKAAGLSPMLAYSQGGASTPSGSTGIGFQTQYQNVLGGAVDAFNRSRSTTADVNLKKEQETSTSTAAQLNKEQVNLVKQQEATSKAQEAVALAEIPVKVSAARLNSANEAAARANAYRTTEEGKYVAAQRAEAEAKQPLWNLGRSVTEKVSEISNSFSAENVARARRNMESISLKRRDPRSITIYGNSK